MNAWILIVLGGFLVAFLTSCGSLLVPSQRVQQGAVEGAIRPVIKPIIQDIEEPFHVKTDYRIKSVEDKLNRLTKKYDLLYELCLKNMTKMSTTSRGP